MSVDSQHNGVMETLNGSIGNSHQQQQQQSPTEPLRDSKQDEPEEEELVRTTKTEKSLDGGKTTTTTTTTTQKTRDGAHVVTKQTRQITKVGALGSTNYRINATQAVPEEQHHQQRPASLQQQPQQQQQQSDGTAAARLQSAEIDLPNPSPSSNAQPTPVTSQSQRQQQLQRSSANAPAVQRSVTSIKQVLLDWCKATVEGYPNVNVTNFSNSWSDGLAFCALIHHFYPDAFDFNQLSSINRRANFQLAFDTAEKYAKIAPLLDVEDMVQMASPDWKCIFTYLQSFYRRFAVAQRQQQPRPVQPPLAPTSHVERSSQLLEAGVE